MIQDATNFYFQRLTTWQRKLGIVAAAFMPAGGLAGQVLAKDTAVNHDVSWTTVIGPGGIIAVGNGLVLVAPNTLHFAQAANYVPGAIPFAGGVATISFDSANLFWDDANNRLGIGTNVPGYNLDVAGTFKAGGEALFGAKVGVGVAAPTAQLHLPASTAAADTASLKIDPGVVAAAPVSGCIESDGTHLYWTDSGGTRRQLDN